jgi:hypothetical protein
VASDDSFDFGVEGPVQAEVFVLWLQDGQIQITGPCGPEAWYIELGEDDDPVEAVARLVRSNIGEPLVVHSTSWRRTRDAVVLSFVAVIPPGLVGSMASLPLARAELARGSATEAPTSIETPQVVDHGLRHLAWLVRDDPVVASELSGDWTRVLGGYVPVPFRNLRS